MNIASGDFIALKAPSNMEPIVLPNFLNWLDIELDSDLALSSNLPKPLVAPAITLSAFDFNSIYVSKLTPSPALFWSVLISFSSSFILSGFCSFISRLSSKSFNSFNSSLAALKFSISSPLNLNLSASVINPSLASDRYLSSFSFSNTYSSVSLKASIAA